MPCASSPIGVEVDGLVESRPVTVDIAMARPMAVRLVGLALVGLGVLVLGSALAASLLGLSGALVLVVAVVGLLAVAGLAYWLLRRLVVVRLDESGYRVSMVRGVGVAAAAWTEVGELATTHVLGTPCVVLRLRDGRTSTIPVTALAMDREEFVRTLRGHLERAQR